MRRTVAELEESLSTSEELGWQEYFAILGEEREAAAAAAKHKR